jgi:hypothetical protein
MELRMHRTDRAASGAGDAFVVEGLIGGGEVAAAWTHRTCLGDARLVFAAQEVIERHGRVDDPHAHRHPSFGDLRSAASAFIWAVDRIVGAEVADARRATPLPPKTAVLAVVPPPQPTLEPGWLADLVAPCLDGRTDVVVDLSSAGPPGPELLEVLDDLAHVAASAGASLWLDGPVGTGADQGPGPPWLHRSSRPDTARLGIGRPQGG